MRGLSGGLAAGSRALISAHRAADGGLEALAALARSGVDYVELDIRRTRDGEFVVSHDPLPHELLPRELSSRASVRGEQPVPTLAQCLAALDGRVGVHADLKVASPPGPQGRGDPDADPDLDQAWEVQATRLVVDGCGAAGALVTTGNSEAIARLRRWATRTGRPELPVGLSVGRSASAIAALGVRRGARALHADLFPGRRVAACGATLVVPQKELALLTVAHWGRRRGVPVLVWTVDTDAELAYWLKPGRAWMVTTNRPARALEIAARAPSTPAGHQPGPPAQNRGPRRP